jgi:hypothetical protein
VAFAILDTGVYIDHWERSRDSEVLATVRRRFVVRQSAVVLSELRRGARTKSAMRLVDALRKVSTVIWEPSVEDWWRAGRLIRAIGDAEDCWSGDIHPAMVKSRKCSSEHDIDPNLAPSAAARAASTALCFQRDLPMAHYGMDTQMSVLGVVPNVRRPTYLMFIAAAPVPASCLHSLQP